MSSIAIAKEKTLGVLISGSIPAALSLILNFTVLPKLGIYFSAALVAICYLLIAVIGTVNTKIICAAPLVDTPKALIKLILLLIFGAVIYLLGDNSVIRFIIAIISATVLFCVIRRSLWLVREARAKE